MRLLFVPVIASATIAGAAEPMIDGAAVFRRSCAACHEQASDAIRAPDREALKQRTPEAILTSLTVGAMVAQGTVLSDAERRAVSEFLAGKPFDDGPGPDATGDAKAGACAPGGRPFDAAAGPSWNGWGVDAANTRFQAADAAGLLPKDVSSLKLKWAFGFSGAYSAFAQPTVVGGRIFLGSATGMVYALDASTGCIHWTLQADAAVRTAISIGPLKGAHPRRYAAYFGDLTANVYAVDAATGQALWKVRVDDHAYARITGAPTLHDGKLYVPVSSVEETRGRDRSYECCTFRGSVVALEADSGKQIWKTHAIPDAPRAVESAGSDAGTGHRRWGPAGGAIWSAPTVDVKRKVIYVGTGNAYTEPAAATTDAILALDMKSGKIVWARQVTPNDTFMMGCGGGVGGRGDLPNCPETSGPDHDFGDSPILRELPKGRRILVVGQKSSVVFGLDPDRTGEVLWQTRLGRGSAAGGIMWGPAADRDRVYVALSDRPTPKPGGMFALDLASGEKLWETLPPKPTCSGTRGCSAAQGAAVTAIPGVVFSGSYDGHLRAYAAADGQILWDEDTAREFATVNGVKAKGGSIDGPGATIVGGVLFVSSGYSVLGGMPGNTLLAFSVDGR